MWFRRDLRLDDNQALAAAAAGEGEVVGLFVLDPALHGPAGRARRAFLSRTLQALSDEVGGALVVRHGDPAEVVPSLVSEVGASTVHISADYGPLGRERDLDVARGLDRLGVDLVENDTPYAVAPGTIRNQSGEPYRVFTPFYRAWEDNGWDDPVAAPDVEWVTGLRHDGIPDVDPGPGLDLPPAGEGAAHERLHAFIADGVDGYDEHRDRPDLNATSRLSPYLKWGSLHPRQVLARLGDGAGPRALRREVAWREFYADVLFHRPDSARAAFVPKMAGMEVDSGPDTDERFAAWAEGRTGFPIVDAGMRQLRSQGWMHNRVRMITSSFLVKDLHLDWFRGARLFMDLLVDGDLASNNHGWQWVAGTGTDAAPYFRIFNPVTQAKKFDPDGDYVRRWVPELAEVAARWVHEPWKGPDGVPAGYPGPIVDHAEEREEALRRFDELKAGWGGGSG